MASKFKKRSVYVLYLLSRCMRPEGPWQRLAAALADSSLFYIPIIWPDPVPNHNGLYWGNPFSSFPDRLTKGKGNKRTKEKGQKKGAF